MSDITTAIGALSTALATLEKGIDSFHGESELEESTYALETLIPAMAAVRDAADTLETLVADDLWTLPTYNEMLTIL